MRLAPGFIPVARSVSRTLTSTSSSRRSNGSIAMQRIARGEGGRGQPCYEEKKRDGDKGGEREREDRVEGRSERTAGKIGGGSQQLLAGMSGNAWDSDPKGPSHDKRPRDPWPPLLSLCFSNGWPTKQRDRYRSAGRSLFEICLGKKKKRKADWRRDPLSLLGRWERRGCWDSASERRDVLFDGINPGFFVCHRGEWFARRRMIRASYLPCHFAVIIRGLMRPHYPCAHNVA